MSFYLNKNIQNNDKAWVNQREKEPDLHWLDLRGGGQTGGDRQVDGGQHHHAGDVDRDDQLVLVRGGDVVGGLVDQVHQKCWQICHQDNIADLAGEVI